MLRRVPRSLSVGLSVVVCALVLAVVLSLAALSAAPAPVPPQTVKVDLGGDVKMEFVLIPKGKFMMGSPKNREGAPFFEKKFDDEAQHEVEITRSFYLAKYPVTQEQYQAVTGKMFQRILQGWHKTPTK